MLRNAVRHFHSHLKTIVLNEVLSLNAQEFFLSPSGKNNSLSLLNEVLSLNAQEF